MEEREILRTLAEVATAFAGFTGIVLVLGRRSAEAWGFRDRAILSILLAASLGVVFFAFVPDLVAAAQFESLPGWRVSTALFATYHLAVILFGQQRDVEVQLRGEARISTSLVVYSLIATGVAIVVAQFVTAFGFLPNWVFFFYLLGMLWMLGVATFAFSILLYDAISLDVD